MVSAIKEAISKAVAAFGYTVLPNWRLERYSEAVLLRKILRLLEIDCVLDVGANVGQYRDFLRTQVGFDGHIVSFEPIPAHVELLRERAKTDPAWMIEGYALGSKRGSATFNVMASTSLSSFLQPDYAHVPQFSTSNIVQERVDVEVWTLDEVLPKLEKVLGAKRLYLKLDTQGFDLEVLKGASEAIAKVRALQTEASIQPLYSGMPDYLTTIQTLRSLGFEPSGFWPVTSDPFLLLIEFDCYMISRKYLPTSPG